MRNNSSHKIVRLVLRVAMGLIAGLGVIAITRNARPAWPWIGLMLAALLSPDFVVSLVSQDLALGSKRLKAKRSDPHSWLPRQALGVMEMLIGNKSQGEANLAEAAARGGKPLVFKPAHAPESARPAKLAETHHRASAAGYPLTCVLKPNW